MQSILINQPTYARRINDIYFDLEHDSNDETNRWFDFILNMTDEQLYFNTNRLPRLKKIASLDDNVKKIPSEEMKKEVKKIKVLK